MSFQGRSFLYDGTPSELYGLYISNIDANAVNSSMGSSNMEILEQKIYRKPKPYFYGSTPSPKLEFDFSAFCESDMDYSQFALVQKWLFSSRTYKKFAIDQFDMQDVYFNCFFSDPKVETVGNLVQGFSCTVVCDSPFAYNYPKTTVYTFTESVVESTKTYYNLSGDTGDYLYPTNMVITMNSLGGNVSITNLDDSNRVVSFTDLLGGEVLTISPLYQTISSSTDLKRISNSNKKFLRLVPNVNRLLIQGSVSSISMTNQTIVKSIGG
jgi:phage-related protein